MNIVFDGVALSGRKLEIDMHVKGIDQHMIDVGLATGMPVKVSPKFWATHSDAVSPDGDSRAVKCRMVSGPGLMAWR